MINKAKDESTFSCKANNLMKIQMNNEKNKETSKNLSCQVKTIEMEM